jgi:hypothetical protein
MPFFLKMFMITLAPSGHPGCHLVVVLDAEVDADVKDDDDEDEDDVAHEPGVD